MNQGTDQDTVPGIVFAPPSVKENHEFDTGVFTASVYC